MTVPNARALSVNSGEQLHFGGDGGNGSRYKTSTGLFGPRNFGKSCPLPRSSTTAWRGFAKLNHLREIARIGLAATLQFLCEYLALNRRVRKPTSSFESNQTSTTDTDPISSNGRCNSHCGMMVSSRYSEPQFFCKRALRSILFWSLTVMSKILFPCSLAIACH